MDSHQGHTGLMSTYETFFNNSNLFIKLYQVVILPLQTKCECFTWLLSCEKNISREFCRQISGDV